MELGKYVSIRQQIDKLENRIISLMDRQYYPRVQTLSDMPKGGGNFDQLTDYVITIDALREKIDKLRQLICEADALLTDNEKLLVRCYYLDEMTWVETAKAIGCKERHVYRIRKNIVEKLKKV